MRLDCSWYGERYSGSPFEPLKIESTFSANVLRTHFSVSWDSSVLLWLNCGLILKTCDALATPSSLKFSLFFHSEHQRFTFKLQQKVNSFLYFSGNRCPVDQFRQAFRMAIKRSANKVSDPKTIENNFYLV